MRVKAKMHEGEYFVESFEVSSLATAEKEIKKILDKFNKEEKERYGEFAAERKLVSILGKVIT